MNKDVKKISFKDILIKVIISKILRRGIKKPVILKSMYNLSLHLESKKKINKFQISNTTDFSTYYLK